MNFSLHFLLNVISWSCKRS